MPLPTPEKLPHLERLIIDVEGEKNEEEEERLEIWCKERSVGLTIDGKY
jgi:hypothetical protein